MKKSYNRIIMLIFILFIFNFSFLIQNCFSQWVSVLSNAVQVYSLSASGSYIFAGVYNGVYRSSNDGASWNQVYSNSMSDMNYVAANGNYVCDASNNEYALGIFQSTDYGSTWNHYSLVQTFNAAAINGNYVFAGGPGVYRSTNSGSLWTQSLNGSYGIYSLALNGSNVFAGGVAANPLFLSTDNGSTWNQLSLTNQNVRSLAVNGANVYAGTDTGVYISTNNGSNWTQSSFTNQSVRALAVSDINIIAGTYAGGIFVSTNSGSTWTARNDGLGTNLNITSLCIYNGYIYAGINTGYIFRRPLSELVAIKPVSSRIPEHFALYQNYPNPFNPSTVIRFQVAMPDGRQAGYRLIQLKIYDILGREVSTLINKKLYPGIYEVDWEGTNYPSGIYFYRLVASGAGDYTETRKMVLEK